LGEIVRTRIDPEDFCASPRQFEAVKSCVAANVEDRPIAQVGRQMRHKLLPFPAGEIAKMMGGEGLDGVRKMDIMEPWAQALYLVANSLLVHQSIQFNDGKALIDFPRPWRPLLPTEPDLSSAQALVGALRPQDA
jgi:hypothetical protein